MDELTSSADRGNESLNCVKRLLLYLLFMHRQSEQSMNDLRTQQERLLAELRDIRQHLQIPHPISKEIKTQPPPKLPPLLGQSQQHDIHLKQTQQNLELEDAAQIPPRKKQKTQKGQERSSTTGRE